LEKSTSTRVFQTPKIDICQFALKKNRLNPLLKTLSTVFKEMYENIHECPYVGKLTLKNFSLNDKNIFMMPQGTFRYTCFGTTEADDMLLSLSVLLQADDY